MKAVCPTLFRSLALSLVFGVGASPAAPPPDSNWQSVEFLTDEFDGKQLDQTKWFDHNPAWAGRQPGYFHPKNVSLADGMLHLTSHAETLPGLPAGYHSFTTAAVKSKAKVLYGYFEIRSRAMKSRATSAFWFYDDTPTAWTEIDVFEAGAGIPGLESRLFTNAHVFRLPGYQGTPKNHKTFGTEFTMPFRLADEYHVYGLKWDPQSIEWYVDDRRIRYLRNQHWHQPLHMNFDSEIMANWLGIPDPAEFPAVFSIDYVRSWQQVEKEHERVGKRLKDQYCRVLSWLRMPCS